ncbi:hypothetical protein [Streptomyces sp. URMC 129]|uniref:hypothetical protein n=1 Tax=Streptomyces sp. URMC 129 TaxID=3423407 RepID=UPI003F1CF39C
MTDILPLARTTVAAKDSGNPNLIENGRFLDYSPQGFNSDWGGGGKNWQGGHKFIAENDNLRIDHWTVTCLPRDRKTGKAFNVWNGNQADLAGGEGNALHLHGINFGDGTGTISQEFATEEGAAYVVKFRLGTNTSESHGAHQDWPLMGVAVSVDGSEEYADRSLFFQTGEPFQGTSDYDNQRQLYGRLKADWKDYSFTFRATEHRARLNFSCQARGNTGPLLTAVECRRASARFSVSPGGPPDVTLTLAGETRYPGVHVRAEDDGAVPPQDVQVTLPRGRGLQFVPEGNPGYQLTVFGGSTYAGSLSPDGQTLTFENVDLALSGKGSTSAIWVAVKASGNAPHPADTELGFRIADASSGSTRIHVVGS